MKRIFRSPYSWTMITKAFSLNLTFLAFKDMLVIKFKGSLVKKIYTGENNAYLLMKLIEWATVLWFPALPLPGCATLGK